MSGALDTDYKQQLAAYEAAIEQTIRANDASRLPQLRQMSEGIQKTLNKMIEGLTFLKKDTPNIQKERDFLVERLRQIQLDYNGLLVNTDTLETLRRIREQEGGDMKRDLYRYLLFFFVVCMGVVLLLLFTTGQKKESTATSAPTPSMTPPLM